MISPDEAREMMRSIEPHKASAEELVERIEQLKEELAKTLKEAEYTTDLGDYNFTIERDADGIWMHFASHDGDWDRKGGFFLAPQDFRALITALYFRYCRES